MPTGRMKFYDAAKGFGFAQADSGEEVHVPSSALPAGVRELRAGTRIDFDVAEGRRGAQALAVRLLDKSPSIARNKRPKPEEMAALMGTLSQWMDDAAAGLRKGRYPSEANAAKIAQALRRVADDLEA